MMKAKTAILLLVVVVMAVASPAAAVPVLWDITATLLDDEGTDVGSVTGSFTSDAAPETGYGPVWDVNISATPTNGLPSFTFQSGSIQAFTGLTTSPDPATIFVFNYPSQDFELPDSKAMKLVTDYPLTTPGPNPIYDTLTVPNQSGDGSTIFQSFYAPFVSPDTLLYISGSLIGSPLIEPPISDAVVTTNQTFTTDYLTLGDTFTFDYWWEMGMEPTDGNFDVLFFNGTEWETFGWELNFDGSSTEWGTASFWVPPWLRGDSVQIMFSLLDWGDITDPTVYLRNIGSSSAPVPEPATITLLGVGLLGLAGASSKRFKRK